VAGAADESELSAGERVGDTVPDLGRPDRVVGSAVHVERRLADRGELGIVEGQAGR
jgi:hypothetical protein